MLAELSEDEATGDIAEIYKEIRETTQVPYVSSLQRHLATRPGWLQWGWSVVGPAFLNGKLPAAVHQLAATLDVPQLPRITHAALRTLGIDVAGEAEIHNILNSFIRVSPTNLGFSGVLRRILLKQSDIGTGVSSSSRIALPPLDPLPAMVQIDQLPTPLKAVLMTMATTVDGQPFVPGLYRMLAHHPAWFAHIVTVLTPMRTEAEVVCAELAAKIDDLVPMLMTGLEITAPPMTGGEEEAASIVAAIDRYRETSPQMVVYSRMIKASLPAQDRVFEVADNS